MAKIIWQDLETHPFYLAVDKNFIPIVKKINIRNKDFDTLFAERKNAKNIDLTPQEYYCYVVFGKLMTFSNIYRTMRQAQIYISEVASPRKHEKYGIHRFDYITYHYAVHTLSYVSILDVVLILVNTVFELGLKDEQCTHKAVASKIKSKSILKDLDELRKTIDKTNKILDDAGVITESVSAPISSLSSLAMGVKTGAVIAKILNRKKHKKDER